MKNEYSNDSIKSLGVLGGVRARPASIGLESHNHTFLEILGNSIDEHRAGFGDIINVVKYTDGSVSVEDFGRGVPMGKNSDGEYTYKKIFDELWAGGKYDNNKESGGSYNYSLGINGVGATGTNYTSDFFMAEAYKNGEHTSVEYRKGVEANGGHSYHTSKNKRKESGTKIRWLPSTDVFRGKGEIDDDFIVATLKDQSIVNGGLRFVFDNQKTNNVTDFYYKNGILDFINEISNKEHVVVEPMFYSTEQKGKDNEIDNEYKIKADIYFSFNRETSYSRYYHNSSWLENGGTPEDFTKNSFVYAIDKLIKEKNLYNKNEKKITFDDVSDSLIIITNTYSTISLFSDQTKKKITSDFMKKAITEFIREQLEVFFVENPLQAEVLANQILINKRSREKSEATRLDIKKKLSNTTVNNITSRIDGFVNCKSKDRDKVELHLVEGKSALGSIQQGRDANLQAVYALRGKITNCLKTDLDKILKNDIIVTIIKLLGCGIEVGGKKKKENTFDINNLRWNKIIIVTDADVDGFHIRTLILTMIKRLMPRLIENGKVYIAKSPLFQIDYGKDKTLFAYSDNEKDEILKRIKGEKNIEIKRSKGLGENTKEMMWDTTMNPETRNIVRVTIENVSEMEKYFELFLGDDVEPRREYIEENLKHWIDKL